jgi:alpha galactosidase A-like protein/alpha galactosidase C-like protein
VHLRSPRFRLTVLAAVSAVTALTIVALPAAQTAHAEDNGTGLTPLMGWSTWNYIGRDPTAANVEAQAAALKSSGLLGAGYNYVDIDDFYYECPGSQGPNVDAYGRWVPDPSKFPPSGSTPGMEVVANYVHSLGEKIGFYVTPGISDQAVTENTPIMGTSDTADEIADGVSENNYNCHGMQGIDYSKPGAQAFINSWADELASWGADYVKLDGVGTGDIGDIEAWSAALQQTGRPIHLELSNNLAISDASTWAEYSNGWRTGGDVQCYCGSPFPLTDWSHVQSRFAQVANWAPYGGPGAFNDYDSIELGDGPTDDGITAPEEQSMMSLWAMAASPLVINADLTHLNSTDVSYLKNSAVIAVDQDSIDAKRIVNSGNDQVFAKTEANGDIILGLFNYSDSASTTDTVSLPSAGLNGSGTATNLWTGASVGTVSGSYSVTLGAGAVQLLKIVPKNSITVEADASGNTLAGAAKVGSCSGCSDGMKVRFIGNGAANYVTINNIDEPSAGSYALTFVYCLDGSRTFDISVNGGTGTAVALTGANWSVPASDTMTVTLKAGENTIKFYNNSSYAPDLSEITVTG